MFWDGTAFHAGMLFNSLFAYLMEVWESCLRMRENEKEGSRGRQEEKMGQLLSEGIWEMKGNSLGVLLLVTFLFCGSRRVEITRIYFVFVPKPTTLYFDVLTFTVIAVYKDEKTPQADRMCRVISCASMVSM